MVEIRKYRFSLSIMPSVYEILLTSLCVPVIINMLFNCYSYKKVLSNGDSFQNISNSIT